MNFPDVEPFEVTAGDPGDRTRIPLARVLKSRLSDWTWGQVRALCRSGRVTVGGRIVYDARHQVAPGTRVSVSSTPVDERQAALQGDFRILADDPHLVVVLKPARVATVPHEGGSRLTVLDLVRRAWRARGIDPGRTRLSVVHRLDHETSGLLVLAKDDTTRTDLLAQFRGRAAHPEFVAVVHGDLERDRMTIRSRIAPDRGDGIRGSVEPPKVGKEAVTHVLVVERLGEATIVRCGMETNRTHQARIHLAEAGHPILGETIYDRDYEGTRLSAPRLALHASRLHFRHPKTRRSMHFYAPPPTDLTHLVEDLGGNPNLLSGWGLRRKQRAAPNDPRLRDWWMTGGTPRRSPPSEHRRHRHLRTSGSDRPPPPGRSQEKQNLRRRKRVRPPKKDDAHQEVLRKLERLEKEIETLFATPPLPRKTGNKS